MKKISIYFWLMVTYLSLFDMSFAAATTTISGCRISGMTTFKDIIMKFVVGCVLSGAAYLIIAISLIVFLWGIFKFITSEGDNKQGGRELMFWGIIGLFVMVSIWGIISIIHGSLQISGSYDVTPRQVNIPGL